MKTTQPRRSARAIDAGAMADIAFLLLLFFLVATVIQDEQGVLVQLPPYDEGELVTSIPDRNVLTVKINAQDQLMVEDQVTALTELRTQTKLFITNPAGSDQWAASPRRAVVSLQNDRGTTYATYLSVYNELKAAYRELWNEAARRRFGRSYEGLSPREQRSIRSEIPLVISEAEPTDHQPQ